MTKARRLPYTAYHVTGLTTDNKRFKLEYSDMRTAFCINLWRGSVWGVNGKKRTLLKRVYN